LGFDAYDRGSITFSNALMVGRRLYSWKMNPIF